MDAIFSRADARAYDRHCMQDRGIAGIELMERASDGCARLAMSMVAPGHGSVIVVCGSGQNGGDGYAIARILSGHGYDVKVVALGTPAPGTDADTTKRRLGDVPVVAFAQRLAFGDVAMVVDALFGTGLDRPLDGEALAAVRWINALRAPVLSVDLPSGLDCDRGVPLPECVRASVTATMVAPKLGFTRAAEWTGRVEVVPIGGPDPDEWLRARSAGG
jgi:NAD(P)H-hydrate epimerase